MLKSYNSNKLFPLKCLPSLWHFGTLLIFLIIDNSSGMLVRTLESSHNRWLFRHIGQNLGIFSSHNLSYVFPHYSWFNIWILNCLFQKAGLNWLRFVFKLMYIIYCWALIHLASFFRSTQDQEDKSLFDICCLWILVILAISCAFHYSTF